MYSSLIGKIEKAKRYAQEPNRAHLTNFSVDFSGENDVHTVSLTDGKWGCTCSFFEHEGYDTCCHVMAMQRLLEPMLSEEVRAHGLPSGLWEGTMVGAHN